MRNALVPFVVCMLGLAACDGACQKRATDAGERPSVAEKARDASAPAEQIDAGEPLRDAGERVTVSVGQGFPVSGPWVSFHGTAAQMKDLAKVARTFRIISIDADPGSGGTDANFTNEQIALLKAGGKNRVLSYLNLGSCENTRSYWKTAPPPFVSCRDNKRAQLGPYDGYPDETWMDPSDPQYQALMVDYVAARLVARGVDGFYLDNLELVEHEPKAANGPCSAKCRQGGLDLVKRLRDTYPSLLLVMQNGTSAVTREGVTGGVPFPTLLDGIAHEEVYEPKYDKSAENELLAWKRLNIRSKSGQPFWIAVEDYAGNCSNRAAAQRSHSRCTEHGFSVYVSDESGKQLDVCYWEW